MRNDDGGCYDMVLGKLEGVPVGTEDEAVDTVDADGLAEGDVREGSRDASGGCHDGEDIGGVRHISLTECCGDGTPERRSPDNGDEVTVAAIRVLEERGGVSPAKIHCQRPSPGLDVVSLDRGESRGSDVSGSKRSGRVTQHAVADRRGGIVPCRIGGGHRQGG